MASNELSLANMIWNRYKWLRDNGHRDYIDKAKKCEDFFSGLQWDDRDLAILKAYKRPALTINLILSTLSNVMGQQIYNRTDIAYRPNGSGATEDVANALSKVFAQISDNNDLPWVRSDVFSDGVITSRGFYDVRLDFSDSLRGEVKITQLNPKNVLIDSSASSYDPDGWNDVILTKWVSLDEIEALYGKKNAEILRQRQVSRSMQDTVVEETERDQFGTAREIFSGATTPEDQQWGGFRRYRLIERQWKKLDNMLHFVDLVTGDMRVVPTDWTDERIQEYLSVNPDVHLTRKIIPRIRWTVVCDNVVLHDDWSPYKHFTVVPYFPFFRRGKTLGLVENLLGPQELLNKTVSQELHVINTTANSGWKLKQNALKNMTTAELEARGAQTGIVLELDELGNAEKIQPNQVPTGLDRMTNMAQGYLAEISGVSAHMKGFAREDVSARALEVNRQQGSVNLVKVMDNLVRTDAILARVVLDLVQEYYTEQRLIYITSDRLMNQVDTMMVNEVTPEGTIANDLTVGEYAISVTTQPERETFEATQFDHAVRLRTEAGVPLPDQYMIKSSLLKDKAEIVREMETQSQSEEAQTEREMQQRAAMAEIATKEAGATRDQADAQLKQMKAQKEMVMMQAEMARLQNGGELPQETDYELMKLEAELQLQREKMLAEQELARERMEREMEIRREQVMAEAEIRRQEAMARRADMIRNSTQA